MPAYVEIDWDKVRDGSDCILIEGFKRDEDYPERNEGLIWLGHVSHGSKVIDRNGNRFTVVGYGSMQGSVVLRDRYRRMYMADTDCLVREVRT